MNPLSFRQIAIKESQLVEAAILPLLHEELKALRMNEVIPGLSNLGIVLTLSAQTPHHRHWRSQRPVAFTLKVCKWIYLLTYFNMFKRHSL